MPTPVYWVHRFSNGAGLGIMARPRGGDWLQGEIKYLNNQQVETLVSLLEKQETAELELDAEEQIAINSNIAFINFPIADRNIPKSNSDTDKLIATLTKELNNGKSVVIHCRMGIGRSSIIAAAVLLNFQMNSTAILKIISTARGLKVPDTQEQINWLTKREKLQNCRS